MRRRLSKTATTWRKDRGASPQAVSALCANISESQPWASSSGAAVVRDSSENEENPMQRHLMLALAPAALALATVAVAQPATPPSAPHGHHGPPTAEMKAHHEAMRKQHAEDLKIVLRLRPDQEAALTAFLATHEPRTFERRLPAPGALTTPQRLDEMAKVEDEMAAHHKAARDALAKFYAALSPDQQKVFDALHRLKGHGGPGGGRRVMLHGPGGHMGGGPGAIMMRRHGPGGPHDD